MKVHFFDWCDGYGFTLEMNEVKLYGQISKEMALNYELQVIEEVRKEFANCVEKEQ